MLLFLVVCPAIVVVISVESVRDSVVIRVSQGWACEAAEGRLTSTRRRTKIVGSCAVRAASNMRRYVRAVFTEVTAHGRIGYSECRHEKYGRCDDAHYCWHHEIPFYRRWCPPLMFVFILPRS